jgi:hypothetical protein
MIGGTRMSPIAPDGLVLIEDFISAEEECRLIERIERDGWSGNGIE